MIKRSPVRLAVWGIGYHAQKNVLPAIDACDAVVLAGVCSRNQKTAQAAAKNWGGSVWLEAEAMLTSRDVDAVYLCTPIGLHYEQGLAVIEAHKHLLCEKALTDKAERLLLDGLKIAGDNYSLQSSYFFLLIKQGRLEKAESLLSKQFGDSIEGLPEKLQQYYFFQKGMISLVAGDKDGARNFFEKAMLDEFGQTWNGEQVMYATILSALHFDAGNTVLAEQRLETAERSVRRARINGVDDAHIYYTESSIHALRGETRAALDSLQKAYDRGFRAAWMLEIDLRLASIHAEPQFTEIKQQIEKDIVQARTEVESFALAIR